MKRGKPFMCALAMLLAAAPAAGHDNERAAPRGAGAPNPEP